VLVQGCILQFILSPALVIKPELSENAFSISRRSGYVILMHFERDGGRPYCSVSFVLGVLRSWVSRHI
jgi:hypothetical protein